MEFLGPVDGVGVRPDGSYGSFAHRVEVQPTDLREHKVLYGPEESWFKVNILCGPEGADRLRGTKLKRNGYS
eukprot:1158751-Pelagomonas_calceolata.AAC.6